MQIDADEPQREVSVNPVLMQKANMNVSGDLDHSIRLIKPHNVICDLCISCY